MIISLVNYTVTGSLLGGLFTYSLYLKKLKLNRNNIYKQALVGPSPYLWSIPGFIMGGYLGFVTRLIIFPTINRIIDLI